MPTEQEIILVVDDSSPNRDILSLLLTGHGYRVWEAKGGHSALAVIEQQGIPDLMIVDIMMPGMNGYELCRKFKADEQTSAVPVIFITALSETRDKLEGFKAGGIDYITKPFQLDEVLVRIATHLKLCRLQHQLEEQNIQLEEERRKTESLLHNVLPVQVGRELMETGTYQPRSFDQATVCFIDIVNFTAAAATLEPEIIISELNDIFTGFDRIAGANSCERIKTIGDAYLFVCGLPEENPEHACNVVQATLQMIDFLEKRNAQSARQWQVRIGVNSGRLVGGIVGSEKYLYDIFGDTVNIAARMEKLSLPMQINISDATCELLHDRFVLRKRERTEVKGKGEVTMYFVGDRNNRLRRNCL